MKIYISGQISGLVFADVITKFNDTEIFLRGLGFDVVNPLNNGFTAQNTWKQHMVRDIELLFTCEAIYMMDNWISSVGASIEYDIAIRTKKDIWFESNPFVNYAYVMEIQNAIHEVTGLLFQQYTTKSRKINGFYARMLFVHHCRRHKMKLVDIAKYIKRDHTSICHLLNKYNDEVVYNPVFGEMAKKLDLILTKNSKNVK